MQNHSPAVAPRGRSGSYPPSRRQRSRTPPGPRNLKNTCHAFPRVHANAIQLLKKTTSPLVWLDPVDNTRALRFSSIPANPMLCGPPISQDRSVRHMAWSRWRREECGSQERAAPFWLAPGSDCANACGFDFVAAITSAKPKNIDVHDMKPWDPPLPTEIYAAQYEEISLVLSSPICARVLQMPCPCSCAIPLSRKSAAKSAHREIRARQHRRRLHRRRGDLYNTLRSIRLPLTLRGAALM